MLLTPLSTSGGTFSDGDTLRWNFSDPLAANTGLASVVVMNLGAGSSAPIGVTAGIPGFNQVWFGSSPPGLAWFFPTTIIGGADTTLTIPAGIMTPGDTVRIQGLVLDAVHAPGFFPLIPTASTIEFTHMGICQANEDFESLANGKGIYPAG